MSDHELPHKLHATQAAAKSALGSIVPAGNPRSDAEAKALMLSSRTNAGRDLPPYYLVYFLLVDLLKFPHIGRGEKTAWTVPIRLNGRLYSIEHAKFGIGVFAPTLDEKATRNEKPSIKAESDAEQIVAYIKRAILVAEPYFKWRAETAAKGIDLNVKNGSKWLFSRYLYFRDQYLFLMSEHENNELERKGKLSQTQGDNPLPELLERLRGTFGESSILEEAEWCGQAAIDAFFSWTEHVFIHIGILHQRIKTGEEVAKLASADWNSKFKAALDLRDIKTKKHYDLLIQLRLQVRNFMAHGAFGKRSEAFEFHSGAGAVPVLLTGQQQQKFALTGKPAFKEKEAIDNIDKFVEHLWSGNRQQAKLYIESDIPTILLYANDGTYERAMASKSAMNNFLKPLLNQLDQAANMDW